ncbi:uncharacterized protein DS421_8g246750 [Arachis hypogaea]|nr:uncharacterized protein DS421_8g246750 [Arachis hypogaea]
MKIEHSFGELRTLVPKHSRQLRAPQPPATVCLRSHRQSLLRREPRCVWKICCYRWKLCCVWRHCRRPKKLCRHRRKLCYRRLEVLLLSSSIFSVRALCLCLCR